MRKIVSLNRKWAFTMDASQVPQALPTPSYFVNLPHSWNAIDGQDGAGDFYRFPGRSTGFWRALAYR